MLFGLSFTNVSVLFGFNSERQNAKKTYTVIIDSIIIEAILYYFIIMSFFTPDIEIIT